MGTVWPWHCRPRGATPPAMVQSAALLILLPAAAAAATAADVGTCPAAPAGFVRTSGSCISASGCAEAHCDCSGAHLSTGTCTTAAECVQHGSGNCSNDPRCSAFQVRSDCSSGRAGPSNVHWISSALNCNSTVPNMDWVVYAKLGAAPCPPPPPHPHPPPPPPVPPPPGLLPKWKPTWDMKMSTMLYTCNHRCGHPDGPRPLYLLASLPACLSVSVRVPAAQRLPQRVIRGAVWGR